ncbi:penicillin-insensitive murein endopeptidase, partial [Salmonella enterica subsp. enterica serovar Virginia]|nr:penicillin-insensitive murein endopeptidase [Salmonella enterica subsp. enterica serovar Virginia]
AQDNDVTRIFVNPAIKQQLCLDAGNDRDWLRKVRPWFQHRAQGVVIHGFLHYALRGSCCQNSFTPFRTLSMSRCVPMSSKRYS